MRQGKITFSTNWALKKKEKKMLNLNHLKKKKLSQRHKFL